MKNLSKKRTSYNRDLIMMIWEFADWKKNIFKLEHFVVFHDFIGRAEESAQALLCLEE